MDVEIKISAISTVPLIREFSSYFKSIVAHSMNDSAFESMRALNRQTVRVFKNPRDLTRRAGEVVSRATSKNPRTMIGLRDQVSKGTAPDVYLRNQIYGGLRYPKRFEKALLQRYPQFGYGTYFVPAKDGKQFLDSRGQLKGSVVTQMLAHLQAFGEQGYKANIANPKKSLYFPIFKLGDFGPLPPGIYKRDAIGSPNFQLVVLAIRKTPQYTKRFYYFETVEKTVRKTFTTSFATRFQRVSRRASKKFDEEAKKVTNLRSKVKQAVASNYRVLKIRESWGIQRKTGAL